MELPKNEATFSIDAVGDITGKKYEGLFTVRCVLNMGQKHLMELERSRLLGNYANPTDELAGIAMILASLRAKIVDGPEWWKQSAGGNNLSDDNILLEVFNKISDAEIQWKKTVKEKALSTTNTTSQSSG